MVKLKIYEVEIKTIVLVVGTDEASAAANAESDMSEIKTDTDFEIDVLGIGKITSLPAGWDLDCIPYGHDGNQSINQINEEYAAEEENIYWVFFKRCDMELRLQVDADGEDGAKEEGLKRANKLITGWEVVGVEICR